MALDVRDIDDGLAVFLNHARLHHEANEIVFYGGEPFLRFDLVAYTIEKAASLFAENPINFTVFTNGTRIPNVDLKFLRDRNVFVIVSIDGTKEVNDLSRVTCQGKSSFESALAGCRALKETGVRVGVSLVMGRHNVNVITDCVDFIMNEIGPVDLGISTLHLPLDGSNAYEVPMEELTYRMLDVFKIVRTRNFYVEHLFRRIRPFVEKKVRWKDCPSCGSKLILYPGRRIGFCEAFMGTDAYNQPIDRFSLSADPGYEQWSNRTPWLVEDCYKCPAIGICGGGCPYDAFVAQGSINAMDRRRCIQSGIILDWLLNDLFDCCKLDSGFAWYAPTLEDRKTHIREYSTRRTSTVTDILHTGRKRVLFRVCSVINYIRTTCHQLRRWMGRGLFAELEDGP